MLKKSFIGNCLIKGSALKIVLLLSATSVLSACAQSVAPAVVPAASSSSVSFQRIDLSGHWEKNYQRSDDINSKFRLFIFDVQRSINAGASRQGINGAATNVSTSESLNGLARITEDITKVALLDINQDQNGVSIDREDNFALTCDYFQEAYVQTENPFGSELCGWSGEQLIFQIKMLNGLSIFHQITLGPDRQELNVTTTVQSASVPSPLTISSYYRRYTPPVDAYDCIFTLSRNNVCHQGGQ